MRRARALCAPRNEFIITRRAVNGAALEWSVCSTGLRAHLCALSCSFANPHHLSSLQTIGLCEGDRHENPFKFVFCAKVDVLCPSTARAFEILYAMRFLSSLKLKKTRKSGNDCALDNSVRALAERQVDNATVFFSYDQ